jgi:hypothetical protein
VHAPQSHPTWSWFYCCNKAHPGWHANEGVQRRPTRKELAFRDHAPCSGEHVPAADLNHMLPGCTSACTQLGKLAALQVRILHTSLPTTPLSVIHCHNTTWLWPHNSHKEAAHSPSLRSRCSWITAKVQLDHCTRTLLSALKVQLDHCTRTLLAALKRVRVLVHLVCSAKHSPIRHVHQHTTPRHTWLSSSQPPAVGRYRTGG